MYLKKKVWGIENTHRKFHPATISYQEATNPFSYPKKATNHVSYQKATIHDINYQLPSTIRYYEATISTISYQEARGQAINCQLLRSYYQLLLFSRRVINPPEQVPV